MYLHRVTRDGRLAKEALDILFEFISGGDEISKNELVAFFDNLMNNREQADTCEAVDEGIKPVREVQEEKAAEMGMRGRKPKPRRRKKLIFKILFRPFRIILKIIWL